MTTERLLELKKIPIMELRREELSNADEIVIDSSESVDKRVQSFLKQTKNPFAQNVGKYVLQIGYMEEAEKTLDECMVLFARKQSNIS